MTLSLELARAQPEARQFCALQEGFTHFETSGPTDGPCIVLLCGMSSPSYIWDALVPCLAAAGYRVLRYDLYGRGLSARLEGRYDLPRYLGQLNELIDRTLGSGPLTLLGYSWGAGLCAAYAGQHPESVARVILQAPGGLGLSQTLALAAIGAPAMGRLLKSGRAQSLLVKDLTKCFNVPEDFGAFFTRFEAQFSWPGFDHAFVSTARYFPADLRPLYRGLAGRCVPVLWGDSDKKVPIRQFSALRRCIPQAVLHTIPGGGHLMQVERSQDFNQHLLQILQAPVPSLGARSSP